MRREIEHAYARWRKWIDTAPTKLDDQIEARANVDALDARYPISAKSYVAGYLAALRYVAKKHALRRMWRGRCISLFEPMSARFKCGACEAPFSDGQLGYHNAKLDVWVCGACIDAVQFDIEFDACGFLRATRDLNSGELCTISQAALKALQK